ncbi:hypothetical protein ACFPTO_24205 [Paraburkholderia denitrificans]|uniref:Uncharacterized protein n=1 Tax=Paraburkholderia denitrificans TaxID=694025 RepID=A0ABW0JG53_9BURK
MSILAGWQRGGTLPERIVWIAIGVVLVVSAHLLPALVRGASITIQLVGGVLWGTCMVTACYGHGYFFVLAQQHAGEARASIVANRAAAPAQPLAPVMEERATVTHELALAKAQHCSRNCGWLDMRRTTLAARLDTLDAEADDIRRQDAERDRTISQRDALLADPVTARLAALLGVDTTRVELLSGLGFAAVLESVACLSWALALRPPSLVLAPVATPAIPTALATTQDATAATATTPHAVTGVMPGRVETAVSRKARTGGSVPSADTVRPNDDVTRLAQAIAAGHVQPTVAGIRSHLRCSQAKATALRRQLAADSLAA